MFTNMEQHYFVTISWDWGGGAGVMISYRECFSEVLYSMFMFIFLEVTLQWSPTGKRVDTSPE